MEDKARSGRRWLRRLVLVLVALELAYLVAGNLFLRPSVGPELITRKPEKMLIDWSGGWTVIPGLLHLRDFRLRSQSKKQRWSVEIEQARAWVALQDLPRRCFRVSRLSGRGLTFLLRPRPGAEDAAAEEGSTFFPEIKGFVTGDSAANQPKQRAKKKPWRIVLEKVVAEEIRQLWVRNLRYVGGGRVEGNLDQQLRGPLTVRGAKLQLEGGKILQGETEASELAELRASLDIDPFVPKEHRGLEVLRFFSGTLAFDAPKADLDFFDFFTRGNVWLDIGGTGALWGDLGLDHGHLTPESRIRSTADLQVKYMDYRLEGYGKIDVEVAEVDGEAESILYASFEDFALGESGADAPHVFGKGAEVKVSTKNLDLVEPKPAIRAVIDLPDSEVPKLAHYNRFLPENSGITIQDGSGSMRAHLELSTVSHQVKGQVEVAGQGIGVRFGDLDVTGDLKLSTLIPEGHILQRRFDLSGSRLEIDNAALVREEASSDSAGWWAKIELPEGEVELGQPLALGTVLKAQLRDTGPFVTLLEKDKQRPAWLRKLLTVEDISALGRVGIEEKAITVGDLDVAGRKLQILGHLRFAEKDLQALIYCKFHGLTAAVEMADDKRDWDLLRSLRWYRKKEETWGAEPVLLPDEGAVSRPETAAGPVAANPGEPEASAPAAPIGRPD